MRTSISDKARLRALIDAAARRAGFDAVAVTRPDAIPLAPARLAEFVPDGFHGPMGWMAETIDRRPEPATLLPYLRSTTAPGLNYGLRRAARPLHTRPDRRE